jgi:type I restriction enzyme M protein
MITGELKNRIDKLWTEFWTGGITNPLSVIEQITFLMFARLLDIVEKRNERKEQTTGRPTPRLFKPEEQELRWSHFHQLSGDEMLPLVRDRVFPHFQRVALEGAKFGEYMKDAQLLIQKPSLLVSAVNMIEALPLTEGDTKGDLYEYLLSKLTTAGINGQFRTPRHIIRLMVELIEPKPTDVIGDPACGTGGFLVGVMDYLMQRYTSPEGVIENPDTGDRIYTGDLLEPHRDHIRSGMLHGYDFDATMLRIASMNLLLHGVEAPDIHYQDSLSSSFSDRYPEAAADHFNVILANPPFKGSLDFEDVHPSLLRKVKTKKTELLFVALILRMLKNGGRCAMIVPDGVLFGSSKAHLALRKHLVEENQLEGVISLPSGVFKPYAGVSTAILVFAKGGQTDDVFFYDVKADGWSHDDKRQPLLQEAKLGAVPREVLAPGDHAKNNLPDVVIRWKQRATAEKERPRTAQSFCVRKPEIVRNAYDLSVNRYKEIVPTEVQHRSPREILGNLARIEQDIQLEMKALAEKLR